MKAALATIKSRRESVHACTGSLEIMHSVDSKRNTLLCYSCWLPSEKGMIFAFVGPMIAVIVVRCCIIQLNPMNQKCFTVPLLFHLSFVCYA